MCVLQDICRYMRGELRAEAGHLLLRSVLTHGIEHVELRDEIYCQLIRQCSQCANDEWCTRVWQLFALCSNVFKPCKTFKKVSGLKKEQAYAPIHVPLLMNIESTEVLLFLQCVSKLVKAFVLCEAFSLSSMQFYFVLRFVQ